MSAILRNYLSTNDFSRRAIRIATIAAILLTSLLLALGVYVGVVGGRWLEFVANLTAVWTSVGLGFLGISTSVDGTIIASNRFAVDIVAECTAIGPLLLFTGAILAYPSKFASKGAGVMAGIVLLTAINVVRIVSLFWIGSNFPQFLDVAHLLVWQSAMIIFAIILWLLWAERIAVARRA